jgi:hypothetical protein
MQRIRSDKRLQPMILGLRFPISSATSVFFAVKSRFPKATKWVIERQRHGAAVEKRVARPLQFRMKNFVS